MTIIHVVEAFAGGIAVFVKSLVEGMPDDQHIVIFGERAQVDTFETLRKTFPEKNVRFLRWKSVQRSVNPAKDVAASVELYKILKRLKKNNILDAVHLHSSKSGFIGRIVCRLVGINKVVYTPNGAPFLVSRSPAANYMFKQFEKIGNVFGGQVVCCSASEQKIYEKAGISAININNGIFSGGLHATKRHIPGSRFRVLTSGRVLDQKNPGLFNEIAMQFKDLDQFEFIWVGDGPDTAELSAGNIRITGWLSPAEVIKHVQTADVYLSTARFEGLPFSVLEALSLRKPVLLSDCVGNRDLVVAGANGDLFQNANEAAMRIMQYYNNPDMLRIMGEYSTEHLNSQFNLAITSQRYRQLYVSGKKRAVA